MPEPAHGGACRRMGKPMATHPLVPPALPQPLAHDRDRVARGWLEDDDCGEPDQLVLG